MTTSASTIARLGLALPRFKARTETAHNALMTYCRRYGFGKPAHQRYIAAYLRADSAYCRAYNMLHRAAKGE